MRQINEVIYELKLPDCYQISVSFHESLLKLYVNLLLPSSTEPEVPPPTVKDPPTMPPTYSQLFVLFMLI